MMAATEDQHPLKHARTLAPVFRAEAFGEVERNHDADETAADALQQPARHERAITVRERDHRDTDHEEHPAEDHHFLAAHPVGEHAGKERGDGAAQEHGRDDEGQLAGGEAGVGRRLHVRIRAGDDADVDAVEQAAESGDEQEEAVVTRFGGLRGVDRG
jgi:hypothetical protein